MLRMGIERMEQGQCNSALACFEATVTYINGKEGRLNAKLSNDLAYCLSMCANIKMQKEDKNV